MTQPLFVAVGSTGLCGPSAHYTVKTLIFQRFFIEYSWFVHRRAFLRLTLQEQPAYSKKVQGMELKNGSVKPFFSRLIQNTACFNTLKPKNSVQRSLWFALASSGFFLILFIQIIAPANRFSLSEFLSGIAREIITVSVKQNSQTVPVLSPATNIDPKPSIGGGDIIIVGGTALFSVESASPEATAISVYVVRSGDTLYEIAKMFDVTVNTIAWANNIQGRLIHEGQELVILPITGVRHTVAEGETLASIAKKYEGDLEEIANYNELATNTSLAVGQLVIVPDGVMATPPSSIFSAPLRGGSGPSIAGYYVWPVAGGALTQGLHGYNGIDIGAPSGTRILAAAVGTVILAKGGGGWNGGYGNYVVIRHDNGTQTLYAHMSQVLTTVGTRVQQGSAIGNVGSTGKATGSHLHFEVRGATNPFGI